MLLEEAKEILESKGYMILSESEADIFMEIEDELEEYNYDANEIAEIMTSNSELIADMIDNGNSVEDIITELLK